MNWFQSECKSCEILKVQLEIANQEKRSLLEAIIKLTEPPVTEPYTTPIQDEIKPIMPHHIPWQMKRQMMEAEDRQKARANQVRVEEINKNRETLNAGIADLERELGIDEASNE